VAGPKTGGFGGLTLRHVHEVRDALSGQDFADPSLVHAKKCSDLALERAFTPLRSRDD
jgi:hypothetical protein